MTHITDEEPITADLTRPAHTLDLAHPVIARPSPDDRDPLNQDKPNRRTWLSWAGPAAVGIVLLILGLLLYRTRTLGHWWGDDWALYIRQANGLLNLNPGRVAAQNEFTVTESVGAPFSPPIYPWGYPAVLAVAIPFVGDGADQLGIVGVFASLVFAACWYRLARPRIGTVPAIVSMVAVCFTPHITSWSDLIQSELVFMATIGVFMVVLDHLVRSGRLVDVSTLWIALFGTGVLAAAAFEVRREGLATIAALGAAHLVVLVDRWGRLVRLERRERIRVLSRFAAPYLGFASFVAIIKLTFPAVLVPRYPGSGVGNVWRQRHKHVAHFADLIGIKSPYEPDPEIFGSVDAGKAVLLAWGVILAIGLVLAVSRWRRTEAHLAAYVVVAFVIGCSASAALSRYFASVVPLCSLLVLVTIAGAIRWVLSRPVKSFRWREVTASVVVLAVALPMAGYNISVLNTRGRNASLARENGAYQWGAQHPDAQEMFEWVRAHTTSNEIVASFKARAMVLETGRNAVQVDDYRPINEELPVALVVLETTGRRFEQFSTDPVWVKVWANARLVAFAPIDSDLARNMPGNSSGGGSGNEAWGSGAGATPSTTEPSRGSDSG